MKRVRKIFSWFLKSILSLLALIIVAGLTLRLLAPASEPTGKLIDVGGFNLHIVASGERNLKPTVVIENGAGSPLDFHYWIDKGLKDSLRVIRYDRAGMGHSDELTTPRDPETIAKELHTLLQNSGESPPYIMVGHSLGGPYIRVFSQMYPDEIAAMVFLDATHHEKVERFGAPKKSSFKYKIFSSLVNVQVLAADLGLYLLYEKVFGNPYAGEGLPDEINDKTITYLTNGKSFRAYREEMRNFHATLKHSGEASDFGDLPIRSFVAVKEQSESHQLATSINTKGYLDFEDLSKNGKRIEIVGTHTSIFTLQENAQIICDEILSLTNESL